MYGVACYDLGTIDFPSTATGREVIDCSFEACGVVDPDTCKVEFCNFIAADDHGLYIDTASHNVKGCNFISNPHGIDFAVSTTVSLDGCTFSGSNGTTLYDAEHSVSGTLTINAGSYNNVTTNISGSYIEETGGGSTTVNNSVYLRIYCIDEAGSIVAGAQCAIYKTSDDTELMNEASAAVTGLAEETFNYPGSTVDIYIRVRLNSGGTNYVPYYATGTIDANGFTTYARLIEDSVSTN